MPDAMFRFVPGANHATAGTANGCPCGRAVACNARGGASGFWVYVATLMALCTGVPAHAQLLDRYFPANVPAYQDWFAAATPLVEDSGYSPLGVRIGSFAVHSSVTQGIEYDSNIFGTAQGGGSGALETSAAVSIDSNWSTNGINGALSVDNLHYFQYPSRSYTDWTASVGGVIQDADNEIRLGYSHLNTVSLPTDVGLFGLNAPVIDQVDDFRISDTIGPGPLTLVPALVGQLYQFTPVSGNTAASSLDLFNRQALTGSLTAGYEFSGGHDVIVVLSDSQVGYSGGQATVARPSDYNDVSIMTGLQYRQSALFTYRALVGYETRFATGRGTNDGTISAPAAELDVIWDPTVLTTVTGRVTQSLQDEPTGIAQGLIDTGAELDVTHSYRRNITLNGSIRYDRSSFPDSSETQSGVSVSAGGSWALSRALSISVQYEFSHADGSNPGEVTFTRHQVWLRATLQL